MKLPSVTFLLSYDGKKLEVTLRRLVVSEKYVLLFVLDNTVAELHHFYVAKYGAFINCFLKHKLEKCWSFTQGSQSYCKYFKRNLNSIMAYYEISMRCLEGTDPRCRIVFQFPVRWTKKREEDSIQVPSFV
jgi:hypothetical protein